MIPCAKDGCLILEKWFYKATERTLEASITVELALWEHWQEPWVGERMAKLLEQVLKGLQALREERRELLLKRELP